MSWLIWSPGPRRPPGERGAPGAIVSVSDLAIVAALVFGWGTLSARLERFDVTAPIAFVLAGLLASVVFALLALEELGSHTAGHPVAVITITVLLSVIAHGATADPLATRYARLLARSPKCTCPVPRYRACRSAGSSAAQPAHAPR